MSRFVFRSSRTPLRVFPRAVARATAWLITIGTLFMFVGCSSGPVVPEAETWKPTQQHESYDRIVVLKAGDDRTDDHVGFRGRVTMVSSSNEVRIAYRVYDLSFDQLGYYFPDGETFRFDDNGRAENIGTFDEAQSLGKLFGVEGTFNFAPGLK